MVGNGERMSRPNSLGLEAPSGEKEPLHFDVQLVGAPPEVEQLVNSIKQVAEDFLYHWKTFSIVLPPSRFAGPGNRLSDIIVPPSCDEFDSVALEAIEPQPLSPKQLHSIMEKGEFEVPSRLYPGQVQVWRVAGWLQMGRARARDALCRQVAFAAALIVVVARDRLLRDRPFSAVAGVKALLKGLYRLLDLAIGLPSMEARDLDKKIRDERSRYLVAELICKPEHEQDLQALASWLRGALAGSAGAPPPVLCYYTTPQNTQIDLRLYRREILRKAAPTLQAILERESRGWFLHFRERRAAMLASQKVPMKDIEEEIREAAIREYVSRICAAIMSSEALAALGKDVPSLLADQLRAYNDLERAQEAVRRSLEAGVAAVEARLRAEHPILARAHIWRSEKLNEAAQRLSSELRWTAMEDAAARMAAHRLHQHRYFLLRDLAFLREREPLLLKELRAAKTPRKVFEWRTRIWFPQNYIVWRHNRGKKERIPTVVSSVCSSQGWAGGGGGGAQFSLQRETVAASSGAAPPCPAHNVAHRTWSWSWNLMYVLIIYVPWLSPLSVRSLFCVKPYATDYELSQVDGTLYPKKSSEMPTMWSRLLRLWKYVSKHRNQFENTPDTGLLGRGLSRQANRIFNYGIIGGLGSLALLLLFPIAAIVTSSVCFVVGCTVPVWMPAVCLCVHVANAVIYEFDGQRDENRWFVLFQVLIWRIAILGILQPIAAILVALIICPLAALIIIVVGGLAWCIVRALQACAWRALLARGARVPAADCAYCRRVPAARARPPPPLTISSAQALAAICAHAELESLKIWASDMEKTIEKPLRDYRQFVQACFGPFSVQIAKTGPYKQLEKECSELTSSLREKVAARTSDLTLTLSDSVKSRIRMTAQDLRHTLQAGGSQLSRHWGSDLPEDWWAARALEPGDWTALAANTLVQVFDADVMWCVPASEPAAACGGAGAAWAALCPRDAPPPDVLQQDDCATRFGLWAGAGACRVAAPALDALAFCPRAHAQPPLPAPHLAALLLYNRDADSPIPLESDWCNEVLKALEDAPDADLIRDDGEMSRSGGGSSIASSTSDGVRREPSDSGSDAELAEPCVAPLCRVSPSRSRAACRWTLTGRGVRLRADLASPEDVNLDVDRSHVGTSV